MPSGPRGENPATVLGLIAVLILMLGLLPARAQVSSGPAAQDLFSSGSPQAGSSAAALPDSILELEPRNGTRPSVLIYRPAEAATGGVVLLADWGWPRASCWGALAESLRQAGLEVLVPELRGAPARDAAAPAPLPSPPSRIQIAALEEDQRAWAAAWSPAVRSVAVICAGWGGLLVPAIGRAEPSLSRVVWIAPRLPLGEPLWEEPPGDLRELVLVAAEGDPEASAVAMSLFRRFNHVAELRLYDGRQDSCALAAGRWIRWGLGDWLAGWVECSPHTRD